MTEKSNYEKLAAIDVSAHIEKKQNLSYLSWAWAVDQLMRADSTANWVYNEPIRFLDDSMMVSCTVTAFSKPMTMHLPVMDFRNKAVKNPDAFAVNTAMMRCLVKAIALHGLGLYIYAGEDLPLNDEPKTDKEEVKGAVHKPTSNPEFDPTGEELEHLQGILDTILGLDTDYEAIYSYVQTQKMDADEMTWVWDKLPSGTRSGVKKVKSTKEQK